jgi:hypothetical protein
MYVNDYLVKARQDDLMRAAAQSRLAGGARRAHRSRRHPRMAAPAARLALFRLCKATA